MKTFVTGGTGFIGSNVVRELTKRNHKVNVLHVPDDDCSRIESLSGVNLFEGDVRNKEHVLEAMEGCDWVFHLAAIYRIWTRNPDRIYSVNVDGTETVLKAALEKDVDRFVHTSSLVVFNEEDPSEPVSETSPLRSEDGGDHYTRSKVRAHKLVKKYFDKEMDIVITAPTLPIGPGDRRPTPTGRILLSSIENPIVMAMQSKANCGDVRDIATGHVLAAEEGEAGESYLLGGRNTSMVELSEKVLSLIEQSKPIIKPPLSVIKSLAWCMEKYSDWISGEPPQFTPAAIEIAHQGFAADCTKAREELGLPRRDLEESVRDALSWFIQNGHLPDSIQLTDQ